MPIKRHRNRLTWSSRWSFFIAALGAAAGLGNTWKLPYAVGENGGASFIFAYTVCLFLCAFPLLIAESMLGRFGRRNPVHSIARIAKKEHVSGLWQSIGWLSMLTGLLVFSFYSVVASWVLFYITKSISGSFINAPAQIVQNEFGALLSNSDQILIWYSVYTLLIVAVLGRGLIKGLENALKLLIPCFIALLIWLFLYAREVGDFSQTLNFMFNFEEVSITPTIFMSAFSHALLTLGFGVGGVMVYSSYLRVARPMMPFSLLLLVFDVGVGLLMCLIVFSIAFASGLPIDSGFGLIFQTLSISLSQMPNGALWGSLFFIFLFVTTLTSGFSLLEPSVAWLVEEFDVSRRFAAWLLGAIAWLFGLLVVYSFTDLKFSFYYFSQEQQFGLFDVLNILTINILLPLIALLIALFAGWAISDKHAQRALSVRFVVGYKLWRFCIRYIAPCVILLMLIISLFF